MARELIAGYEAQIKASDHRMDVAYNEIASLRKIASLEKDKSKELFTAISELEASLNAERMAKAVLVQIKEEQAKRVAKLEKSLSLRRKFTLALAGVAFVAGVVLGARR